MKLLSKLFFGFFLFAILINAEEGTKYGKNIELKETTKISQILESPAEFLGQKVLVEGEVVGVCEHMGCWIDLKNEDEIIRVKVNDGEIVFPVEAKGKTALVEGEVYSFEVDEKDGHEHSEGDNCTPENHDKSEKTVYQIKGLGAVIK